MARRKRAGTGADGAPALDAPAAPAPKPARKRAAKPIQSEPAAPLQPQQTLERLNSEPMTLDPLPALGRYRLTERLGSGAMGSVYQGEDPVIGRPIAIKIVRTDLLENNSDIDYRARLKLEVQSAGRCIHPGIVTIFDYGETDGIPYIVMEYVAGETLQQIMAYRRLTQEESVDIGLQILDALGHAHERGIVHCDVKPSNIIVGAGQRVKITDFGIARINAEEMTSIALLMGTPNYISPERARGEAIDHRADLYALGVVLFRMLTGELPYRDADAASVLYRTAGPEPVDLSQLDAAAPHLASILALALAKRANQRFQSAEEFGRMLRAVTIERSDDEIWPFAAQPAAEFPAPQALHPAMPAAATKQPPEFARKAHVLRSDPLLERTRVTRSIAKFFASRNPRERIKAVTVAASLQPAAEQDGANDFEKQTRIVGTDPARFDDEKEQDHQLPSMSCQAIEIVASPVSGIGLQALDLSAISVLLARFMGPIAGVLVRKSVANCCSPEELCSSLALYIPSCAEREVFRRNWLALNVGKPNEPSGAAAPA